MSQYLLQAGNTPALTLFEARLVIGTEIEELTPAVLSFTADSDEQAKQWFLLLGGAVRLVRVEKEWQTYTSKALEKTLIELLTADTPAKIKFSVAQWGNLQTERLSLPSLKEILTELGVKARFIEGPRTGLSAAVLLHQSVIELVVFEKDEQILLGRTIDVQDIDHWTVKDRRKPYADRKKGMLPPKVARAMVNFALGQSVIPGTIVYDPFCGTGTILIEAMERGAQAVGSDSDPAAAAGAQANLEWFAKQTTLSTPFSVFHSEVAHVRLDQLPGKVDAIVTEPFLGKLQPQEAALPGMFRGLEKLYLGAFKQWGSLLKNGAVVVMIFPRVEVQGGATFDFSRFVDKLVPQGYTPQVELGAIRYHRPDAVVQRDIGIFRYGTR